jgi:hypothetical protein
MAHLGSKSAWSPRFNARKCSDSIKILRFDPDLFSSGARTAIHQRGASTAVK